MAIELWTVRPLTDREREHDPDNTHTLDEPSVAEVYEWLQERGAKITNVHSDYAAALNAVEAAGGGTVYVLPGVHDLTGGDDETA